jgi:two-component system response regulator YcbB
MISVLIIDDDPDIRLLTRRLLRTLDCESYEAQNGIQGEALAGDINPDAILLDIMMPIQDGYETCAKLRKAGYAGKIWLLSALQEETQKKQAQESGANAYIQKPLTREVMKVHLDYLKNHQTV